MIKQTQPSCLAAAAHSSNCCINSSPLQAHRLKDRRSQLVSNAQRSTLPKQPACRHSSRSASQLAACSPDQLALLADVSVDVMDASTAKTVATFLQPFLSAGILLMFVRVPLSWYPNIDVKKFPWNIAVLPTEPLLAPTRKFVQPQGGVDLAPLVWVAVLSFVNEILLGPQGILNLLQRKAQL